MNRKEKGEECMISNLENKVRGEIADKGHVTIDTAIKLMIHLNALENRISEMGKAKPRVVYIPQHIMDNAFTVEVNPYSDIPAGFHPYREGDSA